MDKHIFVICAYKESEYLEACVQSLLAQTKKTKVMIASSTPSKFIDDIAGKYGLECHYRDGKSDIKDDWNYACSVADSEWVTVAHQDDIYNPEYAELVGKAIEENDDSYIAFTDYRELIKGNVIDNRNSKIRRFLLIPMRNKYLSKKHFWKRIVLSMGNPICCPGVTYHKSMIDGDVFTSELKFDIDWDTFYKYSDMPGRFIYIKKPLVCYRIHEAATTMQCIDNSLRVTEDTLMFEKFWNKTIAKIIMFFFKSAYNEYVGIREHNNK